MSLKVIKMGVNMCGVSSNTYINKGSVVYELDGEYITDPTRTSIQTDSTSHIEDEIGKYINHSCTPNVKVVKDKSKIKLIALKDILSNLEITFDYNSTEYKVSHPFKCNCHGKLIKGWNEFPKVYSLKSHVGGHQK